MHSSGQTFQDRPGIGPWAVHRPAFLENNTAPAKTGRSSRQSLPAWGRQARLHDRDDGSVWMLVPTSGFKVGWAASKSGSSSGDCSNKKEVYKPRCPMELPPNAAPIFNRLVTAADIEAVETDLQHLGFYDRCQKAVTDWRAASKTFDDWRLVCVGPQAQAFWICHCRGLPTESARNVHMNSCAPCLLGGGHVSICIFERTTRTS